MSRRFLKVCVAGVLVVSTLVGATSASANWTTNGSAGGRRVRRRGEVHDTALSYMGSMKSRVQRKRVHAGDELDRGTITGIHCIIVRLGKPCGNATTFNSTGGTGEAITVSGSVSGTYGSTTQQLTVVAAGQALSVKWSSNTCLQGTGMGSTGRFEATAGGNVVPSPTAASERVQVTN